MASPGDSSHVFPRRRSFFIRKGGEPKTPTTIDSRKPTAGDDTPTKPLFTGSPQSSSSGTNKRSEQKRIKRETSTPKPATQENQNVGNGGRGDLQLSLKVEEAFFQADEATPPPKEHQPHHALSKLVGPPAPGSPAKAKQLSSQIRQAYALSIPNVKTALVAFLTTASPNDVNGMIQQANSAFASLEVHGADYRSFYDGVRAYICYCSQLSATEKELQDNEDNIGVLARHKQLSKEITKGSKAVYKLDDELQHEASFMVQLESRVEDAREALKEMEMELEERKMRVAELEGVKIQTLKVLEMNIDEVGKIAGKAKCIGEIIKDIVSRLELAKIAVEQSRAELFRG
ncbi:unnamed protein product [Linum tenue]|uniref:Translin-associated factor X-interacting protein 1 N-terminal domain-containing protein n=1 Tax=Linum tenue TaxID=586396 RepID=A0AAV0N2A2_9ROSI|nr:unnamed protein product [Linum tenue]